MNNFDSEYSIQKQILGEIGGDTSKNYDSPYQIQLAILDAVKGGGGGGGAVIDDLDISTGKTWSSYKINNELGGAAHIDDNNVSTGTVFSSAKCEGSSYYDTATTGFYQNIYMYGLHQYALTLTEDVSSTYNMRGTDDLYITFDFYAQSSHHQETLPDSTTTGDLALVMTFYNKHNQNNQIDADGRYFTVYMEYGFDGGSGPGRDGVNIYIVHNYNDNVYACYAGTNLAYASLDGFGCMVMGWDYWNHGFGSWGTLKLDSGTGFQDDAIDTTHQGTILRPECDNENIVENIIYPNVLLAHDGGYVKWDETLFTPDNNYGSGFLKMPIIDKCGVITGQTQAATAVSINFNGQDYLHYKPDWASQYSSSGMVMYAPTTAGTQGQYLVSNGSGAPVWQDLEVASDYVISDADASSGTYSTDVSSFYLKTIDENTVQGVQIKVTDSSIIKVVDLQETYSTLMDGSIFAVEEGETASITVEDQGSVSHTISIDATGNITDTDSTGCVTSEYISSLGYNGYVYNAGSYTFSTLSGDLYPVDSETVTYDSYYLPSSARIYDANVELWLMTTENGVTWENIHYLITNNSITRDVSTGSFGPDTSNMVSFASVTLAEYDALVLAGTIDPQTLYYINNA